MSSSTLDQARTGDEHAFRELTSPYLGELHRHCYRMLGSLTDADDLLQETLLAVWRGLDGFGGRSSLRTWLYRVATNRCLNAIRDNKRRPPVEPAAPFVLPDPSRQSRATWLEPYPDAWLSQSDGAPLEPAADYERRVGVELAFVAALQRLPPRQTAAVILTDVVGFSTAEVAAMLDSSPTAVKGMLQRGRAGLAQHQGSVRHQPVEGRGSAAERELARRFADAFAAGDVDGVVALLTDDAWLAMPPAPHEYVGRVAVAGFLTASFAWHRRGRVCLVPTAANGQPAFGCYLGDGDAAAVQPTGVIVLTMSGDRISGVTRFLDDGLHRAFGLADQIAPGP